MRICQKSCKDSLCMVRNFMNQTLVFKCDVLAKGSKIPLCDFRQNLDTQVNTNINEEFLP